MKNNMINTNSVMKNEVNRTFMVKKNYMKYICAVLLLIGTSAHAWATTETISFASACDQVPANSSSYGSGTYTFSGYAIYGTAVKYSTYSPAHIQLNYYQSDQSSHNAWGSITLPQFPGVVSSIRVNAPTGIGATSRYIDLYINGVKHSSSSAVGNGGSYTFSTLSIAAGSTIELRNCTSNEEFHILSIVVTHNGSQLSNGTVAHGFISVKVSGEGTVAVGKNPIAENEYSSLTATPASGWSFDHWEINGVNNPCAANWQYESYDAFDYYLVEPSSTTNSIVTLTNGYDADVFEVTAVFVETVCTERTLTFANATVNKTYGDANGKYQNYSLSAGSGTVTWTAAPSSVATINSSNGTVYIAGAGTATITATVEENGAYCGTSGSYTLNVAAVAPTLSHNTSGKELTASSITSHGVTLSGAIVTNKGGADIAKYGWVIGTTTGVTIATAVKSGGWNKTIAVNTKFGSGTITGLSPNTTYYVRAFADNGTAYGYSGYITFTTLQEYTITYNNNTGDGSISNEYKDHGATVSLNAGTNFSKTGHTLSRWDTNSGGGGTSYALGGNYSANANVTLYAIWTANPYTITLNNQSATSAGSTSIAVTYNASTNLTGTPAITLPAKTGYDFGGYYTGMNGGGSQIIAANGSVNASVDGFTDASGNWIYANDITLYAKWTAKTMSLTLNKNGVTGTDGSGSVNYDATSLTSRTDAVNSDVNYHLIGYYAEAGTTTKVLESNGNFAASNVSGYITDGKWSRTTDPTTLYAKWAMTVYTVTFNMHGHGSMDAQEVESGSTVAEPADPVVEDWRFLGWYTDDGAGNATNTTFNFSTGITGNTTIHAKWEEIIYSTAYKAWCEPNITITGNVHLTSVNGVSVYLTSATSGLLRIQSNDLAGVNKLEIKYLDADDSDAEVAKGDSPFRLCNDGSVNYNVADNSQIDVSASNTYDQTFSISYTPSTHNVINHYKLQITMKHNTNVLKTVTHDLYGRSLPEEFVVASKFGGEWYALPNTLEATEEAAKAVEGVRITVNNTTTPTEALYAPDIAIYQGENRYTASHRYAIRLTDGTNHLQVSTTGSNNNMWLSPTGSADCQDWWLQSNNGSSLNEYTVTIPSVGTKKLGMYGGNIGYYASPTSPSAKIYFLPIRNKLVDNPAIVTEWGRKSVILDVDAQDIASAQARIGSGEPETATSFGQTLTSVKRAATKYNYSLNFSTTDFTAHKGELLYIDWLDNENEVVSTSAITIPWIIATNSVMGEIDNVQAHWKDWEVHVLPGIKLEADGSSFASSTAKIKTLEVYPGATVKVTSGTLNVTDLVLRYGWTRAGAKNYDVSRLYIQVPIPAEDIDGANLTTTRAYTDWYIDFDQYYPVAVPWDVTIANITYKNSNTTATINGTSGTLRLRYYDGASRAENGQEGVDEGVNWKAYGAAGATVVPDKMVPSMGYAMTAKRPTGKAFSIIRMPLTIPSSSWTALGEQGEVSGTHKNQVTVTAHGASDATKPWYSIGWNFIANPYMATYNGDGDDASITGKLRIQDGGSVKYATIPNTEFTNYDQLPIASADLKPASPFFVQVGTGGTLEFSNSNIVVPSAPARYTKAEETISDQEAYIRLSNGGGKDQMGLIIGDDYTEAYELNADLTKVLGTENTVKTYMRYGDMDMAYVAISPALAKEWIPVTVNLPTNGEYTFSLIPSSEVGELEGVYLIDYANDDKVTNLIEESYMFFSESGTISGRFAINAIVGQRETPTDIDAINGNQGNTNPVKFMYHEKVFIWYNGAIYDATGKRVK